MQFDRETYDQFMELVAQDPNSGCWLWMGGYMPCDAGRFYHAGRQMRAYAFSYVWHKGPVPEKRVIHHICHVRECVNPDHLVPATRSENVADGVYRRGRPPQIASLDITLKEFRARKKASHEKIAREYIATHGSL